MKVVVNRCYGGFSVSKKVLEKLGAEPDDIYLHDWADREGLDYKALRASPKLVAAIKELGREDASTGYSYLEIVEIPFDTLDGWYIQEYDGRETIRENHRTW